MQGKNPVSLDTDDRLSLNELIQCFPISRGLSTNKGSVRAFTCFLLDDKDGDFEKLHNEARKATTLLQYMLLRP
ncbi:hypothetical protein ACFLVN_05670, partial [Chloroflexota bacterium]